MEKFSNWRDKGTGISPFMPEEGVQLPMKKFLMNPLFIAVKLPALYIMYALSFFAPKASLLVILRFIFGVSDIDLLVEGVRKTKTDEIDRKRPAKNQLVVANFVSPIDVLVLYVMSSVKSINDIVVLIPRGSKVFALTFWQFYTVPFLEPDAAMPGKELRDYKSLAEKLVILFPEETPSNNKAILPFNNSIRDQLLLLPGFSYLTIVLRMYPKYITLPIPNVSKFQYLCKLLTGKVFVKAKIVPHTDLKQYSMKIAREVFPDNGMPLIGEDLSLQAKAKFFAYYKSYALPESSRRRK